jgi:hypothetical protein
MSKKQAKKPVKRFTPEQQKLEQARDAKIFEFGRKTGRQEAQSAILEALGINDRLDDLERQLTRRLEERFGESDYL